MEASAASEFEEEGEGNEGALFETPSFGTLYEVSSKWLPGRPGRFCQIPQQARARYVAKKVARGSRSFRPIPSDYCGRPRPARFPKSESRDICGPQNNLSKQKTPIAPAPSMSQTEKFTRRKAWNGSRRLKEVDDVIRDD